MSTSERANACLRSFQVAFRSELDSAVANVCREGPFRVLDCPCGDGFYTRLIAQHLPGGVLVAADASPDLLRLAQHHVPRRPSAVEIDFIDADVYRLPFDDAHFDLVWCAQSFITLSEPVQALVELGRVTKPGGRIAVLETDVYHHVLLPWPVELELSLFKAVRDECRKRYGSAGKFAQARRLRKAFHDAGLMSVERRTLAMDRTAPFDKATRKFLEHHLDYLRDFLRPALTQHEMNALDRFADPNSAENLTNSPDVDLTCLATVSIAVRK